uniref:Uncharacterized protein n=1 Tax=Hucho hucho TaxID=62062 RepID=A0A4W5LRX8_9TELE
TGGQTRTWSPILDVRVCVCQPCCNIAGWCYVGQTSVCVCVCVCVCVSRVCVFVSCIQTWHCGVCYRLLVGAPRAKALRGQKSKVTGGLYNCDTTSSTCKRVEFDNNENLNTESKENQWMGVTVNSQGPGGKIVVCLCAHFQTDWPLT